MKYLNTHSIICNISMWLDWTLYHVSWCGQLHAWALPVCYKDLFADVDEEGVSSYFLLSYLWNRNGKYKYENPQVWNQMNVILLNLYIFPVFASDGYGVLSGRKCQSTLQHVIPPGLSLVNTCEALCGRTTCAASSLSPFLLSDYLYIYSASMSCRLFYAL